MCGPLGGGGDNGAARAAEQAAERERQRQARISEGTAAIDSAFAGFTPDFFDTRRTSYIDYARPELDQDFSDAKKQLNFALARSGLSASTAGAEQQRLLNEQYNRYLTDVQNQALGFSRQAELDVENARSDLLAQLTATEDPSAAASSATRRAELLSTPPGFDPLAAFVFEIGSGLERASAAQGFEGLARSPLFNRGRSGASTIVS